MAFANEFISKENIKNHDLERWGQAYGFSTHGADWTVDHQREMFLLYMCSGREDVSNHLYFLFYWQDCLLRIELVITINGEYPSGKRHYELVNIKTAIHGQSMPAHIDQQRQKLLEDLKEALVEYKNMGMYSFDVNFDITFGF